MALPNTDKSARAAKRARSRAVRKKVSKAMHRSSLAAARRARKLEARRTRMKRMSAGRKEQVLGRDVGTLLKAHARLSAITRLSKEG